ncbi:MAG: guanitoxin biosynthesis MBL fold metallo-hydrolase GntH [Pseudomonadales bacterium]
MKIVLAGIIAVYLFHPLLAMAEPQDYRFPREPEATKNGYPLPLTGSPITKTPVIATTPGASLKKYPEHYIPGQETLAKDEMRITACGSYGPAPLRIGQQASCLLVQLGNGDTFIFDVGSGTVANLFALGVHPANLDKVFITHLHLDHAGGIFGLFDAMGWARNTPLHVWGPSGYTEDLGVAAFTQNVRKAAEWHVQSKQHVLPSGGTKIVPHEFDYDAFTPKNPRQIVYDKNDVKIYAFPVIHVIAGSVGYRLEWNGLSMVYTADSAPSTFEAEQAKDADVFIHEVMVTPEEFAEKNYVPVEHARLIMNEHTMPDELGAVFSIAKPRLGVGMHFSVDDNLIDPLFERWQTTYDGPLLLIQDLTTINVTTGQIVIRQSKADLLAWPSAPEATDEKSEIIGPSKAQRPDWLTETRLVLEP